MKKAHKKWLIAFVVMVVGFSITNVLKYVGLPATELGFFATGIAVGKVLE